MIVSLRTVWYGTMGIFFFTPLVIRSVWKARILQIQIRIRTNSVLPTLYQMGSDHIPSSKFARGKNTFIYKGWEHCNHYICWYFILTITSILTGIIGSLPWAKHKELWFPYMNVSSTVFPISESDQSIIAIRWAIWKCEKMSVLSWIHPKQNSPNMHHNAFISSNIYIKVCYFFLFYLVLKMVLLLLQCIVEKEAKKKKKRKLSKKSFFFEKFTIGSNTFCAHTILSRSSLCFRNQ